MEVPPQIYTVEVIRNPLIERYVLRETWKDQAGLLHRFDGPALVQRCADGGLDEKRWFSHGSEYSPPGLLCYERGLLPSFQKRDLKGLREAKRLMKTAPRDVYTVESFEPCGRQCRSYRGMENAHGLLHRIGGAAFVQRNGSDMVLTKMWAENGKILRVEHPKPPRGEYDLSMPQDRDRLDATMHRLDSLLGPRATRNEATSNSEHSPR